MKSILRMQPEQPKKVRFNDYEVVYQVDYVIHHDHNIDFPERVNTDELMKRFKEHNRRKRNKEAMRRMFERISLIPDDIRPLDRKKLRVKYTDDVE